MIAWARAEGCTAPILVVADSGSDSEHDLEL
jgi:hypothetical protein